MSSQDSTGARRTGTDRCPGVFDTHAAADGAVARIRLPGGSIAPAQLETIAQTAAAHADGFLEITGRGNLQLRAIADTAAVADTIVAAGLTVGNDRDRIRNIEVSPITGRIGGLADIRPAADRLDELLRTDSRAPALSGRFLFGFDDGRGDIAGRNPDVCAILRQRVDRSDRAPDTDPVADILVGGEPVGSARGIAAIADAALRVAHEFIDGISDAWRVTDLPPTERTALRARATAGLAQAIGGEPIRTDHRPPPGEPIVGWFAQDDGRVLLGGVVEHGRLPARLAEFLAAVGAPIVLTPDREILLCDLDEGVAETVVRVLAPMGLIFDAGSPWTRLSSCTGSPGCARSHTEVRADLTRRVEDGDEISGREHWVGCDRCCGAPAAPHLSVEGQADGTYRSRRR